MANNNKKLSEIEFNLIKARQANDESAEFVRKQLGRSWTTIAKAFKANSYQQYLRMPAYGNKHRTGILKLRAASTQADVQLKPDQQSLKAQLIAKRDEMLAQFNAVISQI